MNNMYSKESMEKINANSGNADIYDDFSLSYAFTNQHISQSSTAFNPFSNKLLRQRFHTVWIMEPTMPVELVKQSRN